MATKGSHFEVWRCGFGVSTSAWDYNGAALVDEIRDGGKPRESGKSRLRDGEKGGQPGGLADR